MRFVPSALKELLRDPYSSRVGYDFVVSGGISFLIWSVLWRFGEATTWEVFVTSLPVFVISINQLSGIYTTKTMSGLAIKLLLLGVSHLAAAGILGGFLGVSSALVLATVISLVLLSFPRVLFNFSKLTGHSSFSQALQTMYQPHLPILIVGGAGYIGSHVVAQLLERGHKVRVLDTFAYGREPLAELENHPNLEIITGDVTDLFRLSQALQDVQAVVHLAGIVGDPACALDETMTHHVNIVSTRMLKETVKALGIPRFIFASSCSVYGANDDVVNETSPLNPVSLYAKSKIDSENELLGDPFDAFHPVILRFSTVFGHSRRMRFDLVTNLFTAQAYYNGELTVSGATQWRPFVHVADVARAVVLAVEAPLETVSRQIFNVGDDSLNYTIGQVAEAAAGLVKSRRGRRPKLTTIDFVADRRNYHVSFEKIRRVLGFSAEHTMESGISEMYQHMQAGTYQHRFTDPRYSNLETTKALTQQFHTPEYQKKHYSILAQPAA